MSFWEKDGFTISTDKQYLDIDVIHQFLSVDSYWAKGRRKIRRHKDKKFGEQKNYPATCRVQQYLY